MEDLFRADAAPFGPMAGASEGPYLKWALGFIVILVMVALAVTHSRGQLPAAVNSPALSVEQAAELPQALANRTGCDQIGSSDLHSPSEGVWFQANCVPVGQGYLTAITTDCNRTSVDPTELKQVTPGLYVFTRTPASTAYLWYASSETCLDLVSARVVTAVCADQTVTFNSKTSACSTHDGVLAWINGR